MGAFLIAYFAAAIAMAGWVAYDVTTGQPEIMGGRTHGMGSKSAMGQGGHDHTGSVGAVPLDAAPVGAGAGA